MSVNPRSSDNTTKSATWGTVIILLIVVIAAVAIGYIAYGSNKSAAPIPVVDSTTPVPNNIAGTN